MQMNLFNYNSKWLVHMHSLFSVQFALGLIFHRIIYMKKVHKMILK